MDATARSSRVRSQAWHQRLAHLCYSVPFDAVKLESTLATESIIIRGGRYTWELALYTIRSGFNDSCLLRHNDQLRLDWRSHVSIGIGRWTRVIEQQGWMADVLIRHPSLSVSAAWGYGAAGAVSRSATRGREPSVICTSRRAPAWSTTLRVTVSPGLVLSSK